MQPVAPFTEAVWEWFGRHKRVLPWRDVAAKDESRRAYMVLVSEVMLQQTQVPRVEAIFRRFLREYPTLAALARASNREVIVAWRGMGYNSRALRLRDAAKKIVHDFKGRFPKNMEELLLIKGIGHYTAAAVRNFAFNLPEPCLDTNIRRILHRVFYGPEKRDGTWKKDDRMLLALAAQVLEEAGKPRDWHAALMDFGSLVCTKRTPKCDLCPLRHGLCASAFRVKLDVAKKKAKREPGREIAGTFVPDRIIRGRVVEFLRDKKKPAAFSDIGAQVCIDWSSDHAGWLRRILGKLEGDGIVAVRKGKYVLAD